MTFPYLETQNCEVDGQPWFHGFRDPSLLEEEESGKGEYEGDGTPPHAMGILPEEDVLETVQV